MNIRERESLFGDNTLDRKSKFSCSFHCINLTLEPNHPEKKYTTNLICVTWKTNAKKYDKYQKTTHQI